MLRVFLLASLGLLVSMSISTGADAQQAGLTHEKTAKSGAILKIDMSCSPSISTPDSTPANGAIDVELQTEGTNGEWVGQTLSSYTTTTPTWTSLTGGSPSSKWQYEIEFNQKVFNARLCFQQKDENGNVGSAIYIEFSVDPKVTELQDSSGTLMTSIGLTVNTATTFYLKVKNISTGSLDSSFDGTYHLQLSGAGSTGFTIDGDYSAEVDIVDGEGSFELKALSGSSSATLIGFDADVADSDSRAGSIRVEIYRNGAGGFGS